MGQSVRSGLLAITLWIPLAPPAPAQTASPNPVKIGGVTVSASLRTRIESWDWFQGNANNDYTFPGSILRFSLSESKKTLDWQLEMAAPFLLGLPSDAAASGAQGQLGFGAGYFVANAKNSDPAMLFVKQGFIRFKGLGGVEGQSLKLGRMEFIDGTEITPKDGTLAALKRDRIAHRLIGNFGFTDVGRSFDGLQYARNRGAWSLTLFAGRPTRGVFQVDGWGELKAEVFYGALTRQVGKKRAGEWRLFGLGYSDDRNNVVKTDNRPLAVRTADPAHIHIGSYGGHYLQTVQSGAGTLDILAWGVLQNGSWGKLAQRSGAIALEAGWQPRALTALKPWLRGGYDYGSGDENAADNTHGTFFQVLPTPRVYARFPFFNMMNNRDAFGELVLRPGKALIIRCDGHSLALANRNDLWYSGGGMFQPWTFGYTGRPSNGQAGLATLYDVSLDYAASSHVAAGVYYGRTAGKLVIQSIYPIGRNANLSYLELTLRL
ncbi:MAG TPA: alginate export family protein [Bryobacteraceae bacterium]|nr:alginate export family protein [Bryobacteraceae bacterium]